jgi:hypothetical protein
MMKLNQSHHPSFVGGERKARIVLAFKPMRRTYKARAQFEKRV